MTGNGHQVQHNSLTTVIARVVLRKAATPQARSNLFTFPKQSDKTESTDGELEWRQRASSSSFLSYSLIFPTQGSDVCLPNTGLFATTVAASIMSIIESYKQRTSDSGITTVILCNRHPTSFLFLGEQHHPRSPVSSQPTNSDSSFYPTPSANRVIILWFLSLTLRLICALAATLMQQWTRGYLP